MSDGKNFRLVALHKDEDTKNLCQELMDCVDSGELVGTMVIALRRGKKTGKFYTLHLTGWASNNPTFAAGAMSSCQVLINELALKEAGLL